MRRCRDNIATAVQCISLSKCLPLEDTLVSTRPDNIERNEVHAQGRTI